MKIMVTGAAGFIGSNLVGYLIDHGHHVIGVDNFNSFYSPKVKEYNLKEFANNKNLTLYRVDLLDIKAFENIFTTESDLQTIVHLAAWPGVTKSFDIPNVYIKNNIEATINVLEAAKKFGPKNVIFTSSSSVYGDSPTPFVETMSTDRPLAPYPATKKACEVLMYSYAKNFEINITILRIFNPNGPKLRPDLAIPNLVKSCIYGNEFTQFWDDKAAEQTGRDYCYVGHILEAIEFVAAHPFEYEIFNLGNSSPVSLTKLISTVEEVTGKKANIIKKPSRKGEMQMTYADISKAEKTLSYKPTTSIKEIVQIYYDWFLKQEEWYKKLKSA